MCCLPAFLSSIMMMATCFFLFVNPNLCTAKISTRFVPCLQLVGNYKKLVFGNCVLPLLSDVPGHCSWQLTVQYLHLFLLFSLEIFITTASEQINNKFRMFVCVSKDKLPCVWSFHMHIKFIFVI